MGLLAILPSADTTGWAPSWCTWAETLPLCCARQVGRNVAGHRYTCCTGAGYSYPQRMVWQTYRTLRPQVSNKQQGPWPRGSL